MTFQGKKNRYTCEACLKSITTVDTDDGVTPFMTRCKCTPGCRGMMQSAFYRIDQSAIPDWEWYKPASAVGLNVATRDHVERGGLLLRKLTGEPQCTTK